MATHLKKAASFDDLWTTPGLWFPSNAETHRSALISCPGKCSGIHSLSKWSIDHNGIVMPSVDHSRPIPRVDGQPPYPSECSFHDHIILDGWAP